MHIRRVTASTLLLALITATAGAQQRRPADPSPRAPQAPRIRVYVLPQGDTILLDLRERLERDRRRPLEPSDAERVEQLRSLERRQRLQQLDRRRSMEQLNRLQGLQQLERRRSMEQLDRLNRERLRGPGLRVPGQLRDHLRDHLRDGQPWLIQRIPDLTAGVGPTRTMAPGRAMIGVSLGTASTRGIPVADVVNGGPAARAGIRAGDLLVAVGSASLRVDEGDAGDPLFRAAVAHRLTRLLDTLPAGDALTLRVRRGDDERTVRVQTVRATALDDGRTIPPGSGRGDAAGAARSDAPDQLRRRIAPGRTGGALGEPVQPDRDDAARIRVAPGAAPLLLRTESLRRLGLGLTVNGSPRDTLGIFIASVQKGSAAERAGIVEGMRLSAVGGTSLRVSAADAGDVGASTAVLRRLQRALAELPPDRPIRLRLWDGAKWRVVEVRP